MKHYFFLILSILSIEVLAQEDGYILKTDGEYYLPIVTFHERFQGAGSASVAFGQQVTERTAWFGRFEYAKFTSLNKDKMYFQRKRTINNIEYNFKEPLSNLDMSFETAGLSAEMQYLFISYPSFKINLIIGAGVFYWSTLRSEYKDSVRVVLPKGDYLHTSDTTILLEVFNVGASNQFDWSGAFYAGAEVNMPVMNSVSINAGILYKNIIGEIWPALKLDLENVSTIQMLNIRAGVQYNF